MSTYEVTIRTTYTMEETITVEAGNEDDAVDVAATELQWDWSHADESNEILSIDKIK